MRETKDRKMRRILAIAVSLDAAIEETMAMMVDDEMELIDREDRRGYNEIELMHARLVNFTEEMGAICKQMINNEK